MPRIVSVWLKSWPIARLLQAQSRGRSSAPSEALDPRRPLVLVAAGVGGPRLVALNAAAWRCGLAPGELLSNARSKVLDLQVRDADPDADAVALKQLALWCLRYTPVVAPWTAASGTDGLFLDISGCARLFGGEAAMLTDLARRLHRAGLQPRLAVADTAGVAWAMARYGEAGARDARRRQECPGPEVIIVPSGEEARVLSDLPLAALRLDDAAQATLCRLGFRRIGELMHQPRAPLVARFGVSLLERLDQALGRTPEPLPSIEPPPAYRVQATFAEAITAQAHILEAAGRLLRRLVRDLERDAVGVRVLRLMLFCPDGAVLPLQIGLAAPSRDIAHIVRLIAMRLERLDAAALNADAGFEAAALHVLAAERMAEHQASLAFADAGEPASLATLIDRLELRLGTGSVRRLQLRQSHIPEEAVVARRAAEAPAADWQIEMPFGARPPLLLPQPEPVADVMATVPEGPPRRFRWRGALHDVVHAEGPERIAPQWWRLDRAKEEAERDYYVVEDASGRRFWIYRAGHYGGGAPPRPKASSRGADAPASFRKGVVAWFVQGVFP